MELPDELLVYDRGRGRAHCLNRTAARVWRLWDGRRSIPEIAAELSRELHLPASDDLVRLAVGRLRNAGLLEEAEPGPPADLSRRELLRRLRRAGEWALLLPAVTTVIIGSPALAASDPGPEPRDRSRGEGMGPMAAAAVVPASFFIPGCHQAWRFLNIRGRINRGIPAGNERAPELLPGRRRVAEIPFEIEAGVLQLRGRKLLDLADEVVSIPVGHSFEMLYLLHGAAGRPSGRSARIGCYRIHYADGERCEIPLDYGQDLQDLSLDPLAPEGLPRGRAAWGASEDGKGGGAPGLFLSTWENPRPRQKVKSIDYVSGVTEAAPFCAGMTTAWCVGRGDKQEPGR